MTKRDLFRIIFKLFGLYSLIGILIYIFTFLLTFFSYNETELLLPLAISLISLGLVYYFLFKPDVFINALKLDKGFDNEHIQVTVQNFNLLIQLSIIVIGLLLFLFNIPEVFIQIIIFFKSEVKTSANSLEFLINYIEPIKMDYYLFAKSILSTIIGYLILTNSKWISTKIERLNHKNEL